MKKHLLLSVLLLFAAGVSTFAATVTLAGAQQVALNFYKVKTQAAGSHTQPAAHLVYTKTNAAGQPLF